MTFARANLAAVIAAAFVTLLWLTLDWLFSQSHNYIDVFFASFTGGFAVAWLGGDWVEQ